MYSYLQYFDRSLMKDLKIKEIIFKLLSNIILKAQVAAFLTKLLRECWVDTLKKSVTISSAEVLPSQVLSKIDIGLTNALLLRWMNRFFHEDGARHTECCAPKPTHKVV